MPNLSLKIQALLFVEGDSITIKKLAQILETDVSSIEHALESLSTILSGSALRLVRTGASAALAISSEYQGVIGQARAKENEREIGDAGLEVLAILLYDGASSRTSIDYIRGVNSSSILRTLLVRGLVERSGNPDDGREYLYRPTVSLLAHLGVTDARSLPDYDTIVRELESFKKSNEVFDGVQGRNIGSADV